MSIHCELLILMLALTLDGQVSAAKIIGGHKTVDHSRPYMVLMERYNKTGKGSHCGGFLLNEDFVMTAAHCIADTYKIYLGVQNFKTDQNNVQSVIVEQAFPHSDYNPTLHLHDVMLLKLASKATFNNNVRPIVLASHDDPSPKICQIAGWGKLNNTDKFMSLDLMEADVNITSNPKCEAEDVYCSEGDVGPGKGDSGGPLVCNGKAYGVISVTFKPRNGDPAIYRFAKIPDYRKWISSAIRKLR